MRHIFQSLFFSVLFLSVAGVVFASEPLVIMQAKKYSADINVADYFISEKLDGVRARWNGKQLISRNGHVFAAPDWFVSHFPAMVLDGELWIGRGQYQQTVSIVSRQSPHAGWSKLTFMVFDLPSSPQPFVERYAHMTRINDQGLSPYLHVIDQQRVASHRELMMMLDDVVRDGGEGLMLHHKNSIYVDGRSANLLKLKKFDDAEAIVVGYKAGKGKYSGMTGSLKLQMDNGQVFYVGSGLTDELRSAPPALGSMITFRYQGFTDKGLPRFPVYLRQRLVE